MNRPVAAAGLAVAVVALASAALGAAPPKVILVTQERNFAHDVATRRSGAPSLVESTLQKLSEDLFTLDAIQDVRLLTRSRLKSARAVIFFTNGQLPFAEGALAGLETWVKHGGSILFLHPATDTLRSNPTWHNLIGATYAGAPWTETDELTFKNLDPSHPATQSFGPTFTLPDPVFQLTSFERNSVRELIAVDMEATTTRRPVHVPVAWCRDYEKGKTFTTTLGHNASTWRNPAFQLHLRGALQWLLNVTPSPAKATPELAAKEDEIVKRLNLPAAPNLPAVPEGLRLSIFAEAPQFHSPSSMCVSADGRVFVGEDEYNTGDDRKLGNSRVKLLVDSDRDGKADKVTVFAQNVCSPQGMTFVGDTLFVSHAPFLSWFRDTNDDGVADERKDLITGFGPVPEGLVHHIPSGVHLGIDGFLYVTVGDKGIVKATGADGRTVSLLGGGIVRVRTDGSEMELFCKGLRNPYCAAPDPLMNLFMRDNTNDGGGWNSRLSHMQRGAEYGYPSLYLHFGDEIIPAIADYGGGGATGSVYVSEPDAWLPKPYNRSLYTIDWGRSWVYRHNLAERGATFKPDQDDFVFGSFPTSIDADAQGRLYICNWGRLSWSAAPPIGSIYVVGSATKHAPPVPDFRTLSDNQLANQLTSASARIRREAQFEMLRRVGNAHRSLASRVIAIVNDGSQALESRVAALYTYTQFEGKRAIPTLATLTQNPALREHAIRALANHPSLVPHVNAELFTAYLSDPSAQVRAQSAIALGKTNRPDLAGHLVPVTADSDVMVRHAAQQSLRDLNGVEACLAALRGTGDPVVSSDQIITGVLRTLRGMHDPRVVEAISGFLSTASSSLKRESLKTLQRLYSVESPWDGSWWLTRPDTRGPNYKPARWPGSESVGKLFTRLITDPDTDVAKSALAAAAHVRAIETAPTLAQLISTNHPLKVEAVRTLIELRSPTPESLAAIESVITTAGWEDALVNSAIDTLGAMSNPAADATLTRALAKLDAEAGPRLSTIEKASTTLSTRPATAAQIAALSDLLSARHRVTRIAAALSLARSNEAAGKDRLRQIWQSNNPDQLEALLTAAASLTPDQIKPHADPIKSYLKDPRPAIRHAAIAARPRLGDIDQAAADLLTAARPFKDRTLATKALAELDPAKIPADQILPACAVLAEHTASLSTSPDKDTYNKLLAAAQKYLADTRIPRDRAAAWIRDLKQSGVFAEYHKTDPIPTEPGKAFSAILPPDQAPAGPFNSFVVSATPYDWKPVLVTDPAGVLPLDMPANTVTFLHTTYTTPSGGPAVLSTGADDGLAVYLNGKKVFSADTNRPTRPDEDRTLVTLAPGTNTILLRVNNNAGAAGVQARIRQRPSDFEPAELEPLLKDIPTSPDRGKSLFASLCASCHSIDPHAEAKGPYLGDAGTKYQRPHVLESILRPSAKIAQGFTTVKITTPSGEETGWITTEAADSLTLRNAVGQAISIAKSQLTQREPLTQSTMPEGLVTTLEDLASVLAYLSTLNAKP